MLRKDKVTHCTLIIIILFAQFIELFKTPAVVVLLGQEPASATTMPQYITCMLSESGLLWIGTSSGFVLTIPLPRLEGMPQVRGRPTVSYHAQSSAVHFLSAVQCHMVPTGTVPGRSTESTLSSVKEESEPPLKGHFTSLDSFKKTVDKRILHNLPCLMGERYHSGRYISRADISATYTTNEYLYSMPVVVQ